MPQAKWLGIDVTTGEMALAVRSPEGSEDYVAMKMRGATLWNADERYPAFDLTPVPRMLRELLGQLTAKGWDFSKAGRLSLSCRQHDMVLLDAEGKLLIPALSWQCNAATEEAQAINASEAVTRTIRLVEPRLVLPKLMHVLQKEPALRGKLKWVMTTGDWIAYELTRTMSINSSEAQSNGLFDQHQRTLAAKAIEFARLEPAWFPTIVESGGDLGSVAPIGPAADAADWGDLRRKLNGWKVLAGMGDNHASAVGCGVKDSASVLVSAGTSGTINWASPRFPAEKSKILCFGFFQQNLWLLMLPRCGAWYNEALAEFAAPHDDDHELLNRLARECDIGALRRLEYFDDGVHPHGEVYRPGWSQLSLKMQVGSLQFSIAAELMLRVKRLLEEINDSGVKRFILTGGLSQSPFFQHVFQAGVSILRSDAQVLVSGRTDPLRYKTTAYGALINAECGGDIVAIDPSRFPTTACPKPDPARSRLLQERLQSVLS
jgi:sugar (pentulose or hexulose) kinase